MAGLVSAIPIIEHCAIPIEIAGASPATTPRVLPLLHTLVEARRVSHRERRTAVSCFPSISL
jgi:hypothetical protein